MHRRYWWSVLVLLTAATASAQVVVPRPGASKALNPEHERQKTAADSAYRQGDFPRAIDLTSRVLAQAPRDDVALYLRGSSRVELGRAKGDAKLVRTGIEDARDALRYGGVNQMNYYLPYLYGMSTLAQLEQNEEHAKVVVQVAGSVINRPTLKAEDKANFLYQRAMARVYLKDFDAAVADYTSALRLAPTHLGAHVGLAEAYAAAQKSEQALQAYTNAIRQFPDNPLVYNNRGMYYQKLGRAEEAMADFTRALEVDSGFAVAYTNLGFTLLNDGKPQAAEAEFTKSLQADERQPLVYSLRGTARLAQGKLDSAIADRNQVLRLDSKNPLGWADLGFAKYYAGDFNGALQAFNQATTLDPKLEYLDPWKYWTLVRAGQSQQAASQFARRLNKPADQRGWFDHLISYLAGRESATDLLAQVKTDDPGLKAAQTCEAEFFIAERLAASGDKDAAAVHYRAAIASGATDLAAYRGAQFGLNDFSGNVAAAPGAEKN